jgi:hypothetical protein
VILGAGSDKTGEIVVEEIGVIEATGGTNDKGAGLDAIGEGGIGVGGNSGALGIDASGEKRGGGGSVDSGGAGGSGSAEIACLCIDSALGAQRSSGRGAVL